MRPFWLESLQVERLTIAIAGYRHICKGSSWCSGQICHCDAQHLPVAVLQEAIAITNQEKPDSDLPDGGFYYR
jgi:hypothetical protein